MGHENFGHYNKHKVDICRHEQDTRIVTLFCQFIKTFTGEITQGI